MAETPRTPVAIRLVRPYETEDQFLANELETVGKTSVILIGAHPRPTGVILRFEVTLAGGGTVLRGEGRVLAHKENAFRGQPGLALRFTRLDPKSKALVDRATAIREAKANGDADPMSARPVSSAANPVVAPISAPVLPEERPSSPALETQREPDLAPPEPEPIPEQQQPRWRNEAPTSNGEVSAVEEVLTQTPEPPPQAPIRRRRTSRPPEPAAQMKLPDPDLTPNEPPVVVKPLRAEPEREPEPTRAEPEPPPPPAAARPPSHTRTVESPPDKEALLSRLRERGSKLSSERVAQILAPRT